MVACFSLKSKIRGVLSVIRARAAVSRPRAVKLDLVLFDDAMMHLMRISRIIGMPRGSALLVGVGGSGKQSLTRLASFIAGNFTFQIVITKSYNQNNLFDDLKVLYRKAGVLGEGVSFLFTDAEVKEEGFLEYINNLLSTGEIPGMFPKDEIEAITGDMRAVAKKEAPKGFIDTVRLAYTALDNMKNKEFACKALHHKESMQRVLIMN